MSRLATATATEFVRLDRPFSNFTFAEQRFEGSFPIRRLFSQARSRGCHTLVIEQVPAEGSVAAENEEIRILFPDHAMTGLVRLSFWEPAFGDVRGLEAAQSSDCIGFALLKRDECPSRAISGWHVFESVIGRYGHHHNFVPCGRAFLFKAGGRTVEVHGVLYCQQNSLNKACAQVALRSLAATFLGDHDLTFDRINALAFAGETMTPWAGLRTDQFPRVLNGLGLAFSEFNYAAADPVWRQKLTYQRLLYSGIECGSGALLAFQLSGPGAGPVGHVIPCFGHTFNEDSWAPHADGDYFKLGEQIRYIPSDAWTSSFIVHDDNYGSNLCIPKAFIERGNAQYVVAFHPRGFVYPGLFAEFAASTYFYSLLSDLSGSNPWLGRLLHYVQEQKLILRVVPVSKNGYLRHLTDLDDWEGRRENEATLQVLTQIGPEHMWMIEVSVPDLFSTNKRKIGELLLDATRPFTPQADFTLFVMARFPGRYLFFEKVGPDGRPLFARVPSSLESHTHLFTL